MPEDVIAGRYRLLEPLGRSAMSAVWLAEDEELRRRVALKTLAPTADRARFQREARAVAALSHPHICALYDYGESEGRPFMVLEYLPGGSLEDRLRDGPLPDAETRRAASDVAAGLAHAHERGLVHRDLKPANILFDTEGRPKICDFGIARMGGGGTLTEAGTVLGTAAYISPEQAAGLPASAASDVYSFGAILFRMLTGRLPFVADSAMELVRLNRDVPAPSIRSIRPDVPPELGALADAALAKDPAQRPADGAALAAALGAGAAGAATLGGLEATQVITRPRRRRPGLLLPGIVLALVLLAGGAALALALVDRGGGGATTDGGSVPSLSVPPVSTATTAPSTPTTVPPTTAPVTTAPPTTVATTAPTTTRTTVPTTTAHTTTHRITTTAPPTTTALVTTTPPTTTAPVTTIPTAPTTTTAPFTTAPTTTAVTTGPATTTTGP